jgi:hypothetical protein
VGWVKYVMGATIITPADDQLRQLLLWRIFVTTLILGLAYLVGLAVYVKPVDPPNQNLLPNQSLYHVSRQSSIGIGDFVFFHP